MTGQLHPLSRQTVNIWSGYFFLAKGSHLAVTQIIG